MLQSAQACWGQKGLGVAWAAGKQGSGGHLLPGERSAGGDENACALEIQMWLHRAELGYGWGVWNLAGKRMTKPLRVWVWRETWPWSVWRRRKSLSSRGPGQGDCDTQGKQEPRVQGLIHSSVLCSRCQALGSFWNLPDPSRNSAQLKALGSHWRSSHRSLVSVVGE